MKKPKPDFSCTPRELEQQIAIFFADAERGKIPMTDAALAYHVKLPYCRYRYLLSVADKVAARAETPDKLPQDVQIEHALVLQRGVLRLISFLQASKARMTFLLANKAGSAASQTKALRSLRPSRGDCHTQRAQTGET